MNLPLSRLFVLVRKELAKTRRCTGDAQLEKSNRKTPHELEESSHVGLLRALWLYGIFQGYG